MALPWKTPPRPVPCSVAADCAATRLGLNAWFVQRDRLGKRDVTEIELVLDTKATIGESPTWSPTEAAIYWIDVKAPALYRYDLATGGQRRWAVSSDIGAFTLAADLAGAVVALRNGLYRLDFATGGLALLAPPPFDPAMHRFNEGGCDPSGRFWVGVMFDPMDPDSPTLPAALHSYTHAGGLRQEPDSAQLHNGMAWSADGNRFFLSHSQRREFLSFDLRDGRLGARHPFASIPDGIGIPDGAAIDTEGGYWCALHGGGRLRRFNPDGTPDRDIMLPVSQPTMCAFAGPALDELYVTSATDQLTQEQLQREPYAGGLLRLRPGERGIPRPCTIA